MRAAARRRVGPARLGAGIGALAVLALLLPPLVAAILPALSPNHVATVITSGSMEPAIRTGDIVVTRTLPAGTPLASPSVILHRAVGSDQLLLHRVVAVDEVTGDYVTKGDANHSTDAPVPPEKVVGIGSLVVPVIGTPLLWLDEGRWLTLGLLALAAVSVVRLARYGWSADPGPESAGTEVAGDERPRRQGRVLAPAVASLCLVALVLGPAVAIDRSAAAFVDSTANGGNSVEAGDWTPPTVTMVDPGPTLAGTVTFSATATDAHSGVASVTIEYAPALGTTWTPICTVTSGAGPWQCSFDTNSVPRGGYQLRAVGTDHAGNVGTSAVVETAFSMPAFAGVGPSANRSNSGTSNVAYPTGTQQDDLLLLVQVNAATQNLNDPVGWTRLLYQENTTGSQFFVAVWWRRAGTETSVDHQMQTNSSGSSAWVVRYQVPAGHDPVVVGHAAVQHGDAGQVASITPSPDLTTNGAATVIQFAAVRGAATLSTSTPRDFTFRGSHSSDPNVGTTKTLAVADTTVPGVRSPASPTWAQTGGPNQWIWATVAFR
jgi:signal peptidase I